MCPDAVRRPSRLACLPSDGPKASARTLGAPLETAKRAGLWSHFVKTDTSYAPPTSGIALWQRLIFDNAVCHPCVMKDDVQEDILDRHAWLGISFGWDLAPPRPANATRWATD
jgi:hypothetical protein